MGYLNSRYICGYPCLYSFHIEKREDLVFVANPHVYAFWRKEKDFCGFHNEVRDVSVCTQPSYLCIPEEREGFFVVFT